MAAPIVVARVLAGLIAKHGLRKGIKLAKRLGVKPKQVKNLVPKKELKKIEKEIFDNPFGSSLGGFYNNPGMRAQEQMIKRIKIEGLIKDRLLKK